jgi:S-methylmethionine-dependent homocysteine/selenocysteine methylase
MTFPEALSRYPAILAEGAVIERLRRDPAVTLDEHSLHAGFLYSASGRNALTAIYREYLDIGRTFGLPMLLFTPTWRANPERLSRAGLAGRDVNGDAVRFLDGIRQEYGRYAPSVWIGGLIGVRGDAYRPREALPEDAATEFHRPQLQALAAAGPDFLSVATLPAASEASGISRAMAATGLPYVPSFIIDGAGHLLDGSGLGEVILDIDRRVEPPPAGYMVNCVHHSTLATALSGLDEAVRGRLLGLQANTSAKRPEELDGMVELDSERSGAFGTAMAGLRTEFGLRVLGGCCGTDGSHIRSLAKRLASPPNV